MLMYMHRYGIDKLQRDIIRFDSKGDKEREK